MAFVFPDRHTVYMIKEKYPPGTRVRILNMPDDPYPVPPGTRGTVRFVDDAGNIHVCWATGSTLGLIVGCDEFEVLSD